MELFETKTNTIDSGTLNTRSNIPFELQIQQKNNNFGPNNQSYPWT